MASKRDNPSPIEDWKTIDSKLIFENKWISIQQDQIRQPNGQEFDYTYVNHPGSVFVVPFTENGDLLLIKSYRHILGMHRWEIPAGTLADKKGISVEQAARDELREETGYDCEHIEKLGTFYLSNGFAICQGHFFSAYGCKPKFSTSFDTGELITKWVPKSKDEAAAMVMSNQITDGDSAFAILLALSKEQP